VKRYTNRDFVHLMEEVEAQGGLYAALECHSEEIDDLSKMGQKPAMSTGCEEAAIFIADDAPDAPHGRTKQRRNDNGELEWTPVLREGNPSAGKAATATVCANDDLMRLWPRFQHVISDADPTTGVR
jgi:hypothetical protein